MTATAVTEVTIEQVAEAELYAGSYTGTFEFLTDMRDKVLAGDRLSPGMVAAILRCKVRDDQRTARSIPSAAPTAPLAPGFYIMGNDVYKIQQSRQSTNRYAKKLVTGTDQNGRPRGSFVYAPGVVGTLTAAMAVTETQAAEFGHRFGFCIFCGIYLEDDRSVQAGYGPVCARNRGLAWG